MGIYGHAFENYKSIDHLLELFNFEYDSLINEFTFLNKIQIVSEANKIISNIWNKLKQIFQKAKVIFSNLLMNVAKLKSTKMPKQMCDDLVKVLQVLQPRTLVGTKELINYYKKAVKGNYTDKEVSDDKIKRNSGLKGYAMDTSVEFEIDKSTVDITESIDAIKKMEEYSRLQENNYSDDNAIEVPLTKITSDMQDAKANCFDFESHLSDIQNLSTKAENEELNNKVIKFCKKIIEYYHLRINLLTKFFNNAKFSIKNISGMIKNKAIETKLSTNRNIMKIKVKLGRDKTNQVKNNLRKLLELNKSEQYKEYESVHSDTCKILGIPEKVTFMCAYPSQEIESVDDVALLVFYYKNDYTEIPVGGRPLYHHSTSKDSLSELKPTAIGNWDATFYPEPRVYFHMNVILNKAAKNIDTKEEFEVGWVEKDADGNIIDSGTETRLERMFDNNKIYKCDTKVDYVYKDTEMGNTGTFVISEKPIKVKEIDYEEWKKENGFK